MAGDANALRWDGAPGHHELYVLSVTDRESGCGLSLRFAMRAPLPGKGQPACSLSVLGSDPAAPGAAIARRATLPVEDLRAHSTPFSLTVGGSQLDDGGTRGALDDVRWHLSWTPRLPPVALVPPFLGATRLGPEALVVAHADLAVDGYVSWVPHSTAGGRRELTLDGARGAQWHGWGRKRADTWARAHCNDFATPDGEPVADTYLAGATALGTGLPTLGGPPAAFAGRFAGRDFRATSPLRATLASSRFGLTSWRFETQSGDRRITGEVDAPRDGLIGLATRDPDGRLAYVYASEIASMRVQVWERARHEPSGWHLERALASRSGAHFLYGQRDRVPDVAIQAP